MKILLAFLSAAFLSHVVFAEVPYYLKQLNLDEVRAKGITGKGVRVGVVDGPISEVTFNGEKDMTIAKRGGCSGGKGHGTAVCSIIASKAIGIAPDCELYAYDTGSVVAGEQVKRSIAGVWWCATNGCQVINMSFSFNPVQPGVKELHDWFNAEMRKIREQTGAILINSLGNNPINDLPYFPQDTDLSICIGGVKQDNQADEGLTKSWRQDFCVYGRKVPAFVTADGRATLQNGTSFSAPMATAIVALLLQQNPKLTQDEVYGILKDTCKKLAPGKTREFGWGLLQAAILPKKYKRQAQYDAERKKHVKLESIKFNHPEFVYNQELGLFDVTLKVGTVMHINYKPNPANATDKRAYWYAGNLTTLNPIIEDDVLRVKDDPKLVGRFGTYELMNSDYDNLVTLRVHFAAKQ